ncbi:hypothetical protein NKI19_31835 [Mesorhizobium sp. M0751]|uniref:hypothetical protein n=1 Tax=unclassified Mesorhizobium TaxID=325217 RepID=UPI00333749BA
MAKHASAQQEWFEKRILPEDMKDAGLSTEIFRPVPTQLGSAPHVSAMLGSTAGNAGKSKRRLCPSAYSNAYVNRSIPRPCLISATVESLMLCPFTPAAALEEGGVFLHCGRVAMCKDF